MKQLTLNQQLALMPVSIPETVLDFLEDFNFPNAMHTDVAKESLDTEFWRKSSADIVKQLEAFRAAKGKVISVEISAGGRELSGAFLCKLTCELGACGVGLMTRMKEKQIYKIILEAESYSEDSLRNKLKE